MLYNNMNILNTVEPYSLKWLLGSRYKSVENHMLNMHKALGSIPCNLSSKRPTKIKEQLELIKI